MKVYIYAGTLVAAIYECFNTIIDRVDDNLKTYIKTMLICARHWFPPFIQHTMSILKGRNGIYINLFAFFIMDNSLGGGFLTVIRQVEKCFDMIADN